MASSDLFATFMNALPMAGSALRAYLRRRFRERRLDLTPERPFALGYRWQHDGASQQELARAASRDQATATATLDNLVRRDLVARRANRVLLTAQGPTRERVQPLGQELFAVARQRLAPGQLRTSLVVLAKITQNLARVEK